MQLLGRPLLQGWLKSSDIALWVMGAARIPAGGGGQQESQNTVQFFGGNHRDQFCFFSSFQDIIEGLHGAGVYFECVSNVVGMHYNLPAKCEQGALKLVHDDSI